jgi:F-type H+-transporting ATPase subunit b
MSSSVTTFVFETVNFLLLMWILQRLVYRPLREAIRARRAEIEERKEEAEHELAEANELREDWEQKHRELASLRSQVREETLEGALQERARLLEQARADAAQERTRVERLLDSERRSAEEWVRTVAIERGADLAGHLLLKLAPDVVDRVLHERLVDTLREAKGEIGRQLADLESVEVIGATPPGEALLGPLRKLLAQIAGSPVPVEASTDPSLLAGAVVRCGDTVFDGSVAGQLEAFRKLAESLPTEPAEESPEPEEEQQPVEHASDG